MNELMATTILMPPAIALILGWLLDKVFGDPPALPHPIVGFGQLIRVGEHALNKGNHRVWKGGFLAIGLIAGIFLLTYCIQIGLYLITPALGMVFAIIMVFYCLAGTTLAREVKMVFEATDRSLEEGRKQVARIVGRDTSSLSAQEIRTAALESLAENLSDGVIAPLFWYLLLGLPGMVAYKMINTLDSMLGYKNERYLYFGRVAARIDDVANYIPARLTAFLMIIVTGRFSLFKFVYRYGNQHASPNSGYPEAALAGILDCRFGGEHHYFGKPVYKPYIGAHAKELTTRDMQLAIRVNYASECLLVVLIAALSLCLHV